MDALASLEAIVRDLMIFVAAMSALLVALLVFVARLPDAHPLKRLLTALSLRLGATLAAGALAVPLAPIPGLDALYDVGAPLALIWYWWTFFRDARRRAGASAPPPATSPRKS